MERFQPRTEILLLHKSSGDFLFLLISLVFWPLNEKYKDLPEINGRELFTLIPLGIIVIILGVYPMPVLDLLRGSLANLLGVILR